MTETRRKGDPRLTPLRAVARGLAQGVEILRELAEDLDTRTETEAADKESLLSVITGDDGLLRAIEAVEHWINEFGRRET